MRVGTLFRDENGFEGDVEPIGGLVRWRGVEPEGDPASMVEVAEPELAELTRELHPTLVGVLTLYLDDRHLAEDLAQESLIRLHQHWPRVRHHPNPEAWTTRVALNLASTWWRRRGAERRANRRASTDLRDPSRAAGADATDVLAIRAAVGALPDRQRAVVVLRYFQGCSVRETAEVLGCPEGTVKSLTSTAVARLRRSLADAPDPIVTDPSGTEPTHA
ncbi:MAG: SigE family RNA polymerase sigma factor, partial [Acidimicrobiales bacterium]|nr:SigE family RNA polymerase sigma factor [Acidimicrobiales bacterium]